MFKALARKLKDFLDPAPPFEPNVSGQTFAYSNSQYHIRVTPERILYHNLDGPFFDDLYQRAWFVYGEHLDQEWFRSKGIDLLDKEPWFRNSMDRMIFLDNARKFRQDNVGKIFRDKEGNHYILEQDCRLRLMVSFGGGGGGSSWITPKPGLAGVGGVSVYGGSGGHGDTHTVTT